jgi:hypothetical protein
MRDALNSLCREDRIEFPQLMVATLKALARMSLFGTPSDKVTKDDVSRLGNTPLAFLLIEAHTKLVTLGYIVLWPKGIYPPEPNAYRVTERGKEWALTAAPPLEDSDGFLAALNARIPTLDLVVKQYIVEAVVTYNRQVWFAAAVMVGAASEKVVYMLAEALLVKTGGTNRRSLENAIKERSLPSMFEQINKVLAGHIESKDLPYEIHEGCEPHLISLFEAIRAQRNDAVHPTVGEVTPDTVRLTLSAFPSACRKAYDLIGWCQMH